MLEQLIKRKFYLDKHLRSPLLKEREDYLLFWAEKGFANSTLKSIAAYTLRIVEFLHLEKSITWKFIWNPVKPLPLTLACW